MISHDYTLLSTLQTPGLKWATSAPRKDLKFKPSPTGPDLKPNFSVESDTLASFQLAKCSSQSKLIHI